MQQLALIEQLELLLHAEHQHQQQPDLQEQQGFEHYEQQFQQLWQQQQQSWEQQQQRQQQQHTGSPASPQGTSWQGAEDATSDTAEQEQPGWRLSLPESIDIAEAAAGHIEQQHLERLEEADALPVQGWQQRIRQQQQQQQTYAADSSSSSSGNAYAARHTQQHAARSNRHSQQQSNSSSNSGSSSIGSCGSTAEAQRQLVSATADSSSVGASQACAVPEEWLQLTAASSWHMTHDLQDDMQQQQLDEQLWQQPQPVRDWRQHSSPSQCHQCAPAALQQVQQCFAAWQQQASQAAAASALSEQQWSAYHCWRLLARGFRAWRGEAQQGAGLMGLLEEQAAEHARLHCLRRAVEAWRYR
jgi:hypothetical protein